MWDDRKRPVTGMDCRAFPCMRFLFLAAAVLLAASCNDTATVSTSDVEGAYILVSVRNEPLPARAPCSPLRIQSAHLGLGQVFDVLLHVFHRILEFLHAFTKTFHEFRYFFSSEKDKHEQTDQKNFLYAHTL